MSPRRVAHLVALVALVPLVAHCTVTGEDDSEAISLGVAVAAAPAAAELTTDLGLQVTVDLALAAIETVEIVPCDAMAARARGRGSLLDALGLLGVAHAHTPVEPTRTGIPAVLPLSSAGGVTIGVGTLKPPPGRYCAARVTFGPADGDAEGLPADGGMVGRTLVVEGTHAADGGEPAPFRLHTRGRVAVDVPIDLVLGEDGRRTATARVTVDGSGVLDGVDLAAVDGEAGGHDVLAALSRAVTVDLE